MNTSVRSSRPPVASSTPAHTRGHRLKDGRRDFSADDQTDRDDADSYVADLSHELRGPLTVLDLRLQELDSGTNLSGAPAENLAIIRSEVRGLFDVVNDLLSLTQFDTAFRSEPTDVYELTAEVVQSMALISATSAIELVVTGQRTLLTAVSPVSLRRCLMALIDNAIKHSFPGGQVTADIRCQKGDVTIDIVDGGPGVDDLVLARMFERNVRTDGDAGGRPSFGIGLALVHEIAARVGGEASLRASGPTGTTMRLRLPQLV